MVKIDYEIYDKISEMEEAIKSTINVVEIGKSYIVLGNKEQQIIYTLTMISILYKEKCYEEYLGKNVNGNIDDIAVDILYEIIDSLKKCIEYDDIMRTIRIIKDKAFIIEPFLQRYFSKKEKNYITAKHSMEIVINQNNQKELLQYNPFAINQILQYQQDPLVKEEIIIQEITEYLVEAQQIYDNEEEILKHIKTLMEKNYESNKLEEVISFIISNTYQEVIEHKENENRNIIIPIIENPNINIEDIIKHFKEKDLFSNMILKIFLKYNLEIEKGRLQELSKKPSKQYAKRIYKK